MYVHCNNILFSLADIYFVVMLQSLNVLRYKLLNHIVNEQSELDGRDKFMTFHKTLQHIYKVLPVKNC